MRRSLRIIITHLRAIFSWRICLSIVILFTFIFLLKLNSFSTLNLRDYIKITFYGPKNLTENITNVLIWSMLQFYLLFIIGNYIYNESKSRSIYTISKIGNYYEWYRYLQISIMIICLVYYLIGISLEIILYMTLTKKPININDISCIINIFFILFLSSYLMASVYFCLVLLSKQHTLSFIATVLLLYISISLGNGLNIDRFIPFNRGILAKHYALGFSFATSYIYIIMMILINLLIINKYLLKDDFIKFMD